MDEIETRKQAIAMYLSNHKPMEICRSLDKSRPWFYKWLRRYHHDPKGQWYLDHSSVPHTCERNYSKEQENQVIQIRKKLEKNAYAQVGAISIQWEMHKLNLPPLQIWTIDRIIKRNQLTQTKPLPQKRKNEYPDYSKAHTHELDLVGPRYLKKGGKHYFCNLIATQSHCIHLNVLKNKRAIGIVDSIMRFWKQFGLPDFLQLDNELSFRGSNRYPHSFGLLIRFVLSQGVTPVFIPQAEPWRNGIIEKFNDTFDKKCFRTQSFDCHQQLVNEVQAFERFHNQNYRYSAHNNRTPMQVHRQNQYSCYLDPEYQLPEFIPLETGEIIIIRFIRSNRLLKVFGESFVVEPELIYNYVVACISIEAQALKIYLDDKLVQEFCYPTPVDWM